MPNDDGLSELLEKYQTLLDVFRAYWKANFAPECQEDTDSDAFSLGARIRYGIHCMIQGRPIPSDCRYEGLEEEICGWISYREKPNYGNGPNVTQNE